MLSEQRRTHLRAVTFFGGLNDDQLDSLAGLLRIQKHSKDSVIVGQDAPGDALYILETGRVKVVLYGESGRDVILSIFKGGDVFGEMSLLDGQPRSANVIATEASTVAMLPRDDFLKFLNVHPSVAVHIMAELSRRLRHADDIIGNLALLDVHGRVARILIDLANSEGVSGSEGITIAKRPTQQEMASMIGTSRETVSRVLSEFQRRGYLSMSGKSTILSHGFSELDLGGNARGRT